MAELPVEDPRRRRSRLIGAGALAGMGVLHFAAPRAFDRIIPGWLPGDPRTWTYVSGVWELASAALVANRRTSRLGGWAAAATLVAVYPANVQMAVDNPPTTPFGVALLLRLPLQVPMIAWALGHARGRAGRPTAIRPAT
ncbi:MAG TPA: hypothetical protein VFK43_18050 [Acidimicrobiales bacterium]|nr:hypothetical protein [Acidimicrobiales bacterium]